jgi:hypothetical protein
MSDSIRVSPQTSKVFASEARSTGSDATVIRMRIKKSHSRKPSFYTTYSSKVMPINHLYTPTQDSVIINIIHDVGGAKAPSLVYEAIAGGP